MITVLSAAKFEADPTLKVLEDMHVAHEFIELGIGPIHAAKKSSTLHLEGKKVLYLGSCGVFSKDFIPEVVTCENVYWSPPSVRSGQSNLIEDVEPPITFENLSRFAKNFKKASVFCSPTITLDETLIPSLSPVEPKLKPENIVSIETSSKLLKVENMELYSVADKLCEASSLSVLLGITNAVGPSGRTQWNDNFHLLAQKCADFSRRYITQL